MLTRCTAQQGLVHGSLHASCLRKHKQYRNASPQSRCMCLWRRLQEKPRGEPVVVTLSESLINPTPRLCLHQTSKESDVQSELDLTSVVVCEAHRHEVFGWTVVIHLVTSVNTTDNPVIVYFTQEFP